MYESYAQRHESIQKLQLKQNPQDFDHDENIHRTLKINAIFQSSSVIRVSYTI